ncbi:L-rhamnose mutarotase [Agrococcus sp. SGAir0287]|uniref:L-rhamnose mutarotase n=1 Tax=Agrococcus sp. SGAir0287 TaxID=2070347 RepID=UPI0010CD07FB|nr:L-rhamnose mutarotase [Agrococcus sp. SGAir0287]QCR18366.1 L-rhamnose mutarotase [Agrococcus sp. SGAir0287]
MTQTPGASPAAQHVCFRLRVRPEAVATYREAHARVWPEMLEALHDTGWRDYRIFVADDGTVIGTVTVDDLGASLAAMAARDVNARWQAAMQPLLADADRPADESLELLPLAFDLDRQRTASTPSPGAA